MNSALRIIDILDKVVPLDLAVDTPASRYVRNLGIPAGAELVSGAFFSCASLYHWALAPDSGRPRGSLPALVAQARTDTARVLHCVFLTEEGDLAPCKWPALRLGILNGACIKISEGEDPDELVISRTIQTGLRAAFCARQKRNVVAALLASNIPNLEILDGPNAPRRIVLACDGDPAKHSEREKTMLALCDRGFGVRMEIMRESARAS